MRAGTKRNVSSRTVTGHAAHSATRPLIGEAGEIRSRSNRIAVLRQREAELLAEHHNTLAGPLANSRIQFGFRRGFVNRFSHDGVFRGSLPSFTSINRLRFFMDGRVTRSIADEPETRPFYLAPEAQYEQSGQYRLDCIDFPAAIKFKFSTSRRWSFRGQFHGNMIVVDPRGKRRSSHGPIRYTLIRVFS